MPVAPRLREIEKPDVKLQEIGNSCITLHVPPRCMGDGAGGNGDETV
jgi:hypothetical protein